MGQMRARTQLMTSLAGEGLSTVELAQAVTGVKTVSEVFADRDARIARNAPQQEGQQ
jgi:hypothetical protein